MSWAHQKINAYVNRLIRKEIYSKQVVARPLFFFMSAHAQMELAKLLRPYGSNRKHPNDNFKYGVSVGGTMGLARRQKTLGSLYSEIRFQTGDPDDGTSVEYGGATGAASVFSEDLAGTAKFGWSKTAWNLKVRNSTIENAKGSTQIASVLEEVMAMSFNVSFGNRQAAFWNGTLTAAQQAAVEWSAAGTTAKNNILGLRHMVSDGLTAAERAALGVFDNGTDESAYQILGTVDRSQSANGEDKLRSTVLNAADLKANGYMNTTRPSLELIRRMKNINALGGIQNIDPEAGNLAITTSDLWNVFADESEAENTIYNMPLTVQGIGSTVGFKLPVVRYGDTYITYDPDCPAGELYLLSTGSFLYEIQQGKNYQIQGFTNKAENEENGDDYSWNKIWLKDRMSCTCPWLNTKVTGLTTV